MNTTATRLKQIMDERNLRQVDLLNLCKPYCEKYGVKLGKSALSQYISGEMQPKQDKLFVLGLALNVNEAWLMGYDVPMERGNIHNSNSSSSAVTINVYGRVAAGIPLEAIEDITDTEEIPADMARGGQFFGLQIKGDSMEPKISNGDVVIVRKQADAESDEIVIAMVNGDDAVCKRLKKYDEGISLISDNPAYPPMFFTLEQIESRPVRILGKVVELRAKF